METIEIPPETAFSARETAREINAMRKLLPDKTVGRHLDKPHEVAVGQALIITETEQRYGDNLHGRHARTSGEKTKGFLPEDNTSTPIERASPAEVAPAASSQASLRPREGLPGLLIDEAGTRAETHALLIREFFNRRAADWDLTQDHATTERSRDLILSLGIERGSSVLDAGCGTGILLPYLLEAVGDEGSVCALDVAEEMLKTARAKLQRPNLQYLHADIVAMPFLEESFDLVICHNCFPHVADKEGAIGEMYRVLQAGGRVVISHTEGREAVNARHLHLGGAVGGDLLPEEATMRRWLQEAGFEVLEFRDGEEGYLLEARKPEGAASRTARKWGERGGSSQ